MLKLPEIQRSAAELGLKPGIHQGGPGVYEEHPVAREPVPIHIEWQNLSLQDALNRFARVAVHTVWIYDQEECDGTYIIETLPD